jgi:hypothetical protein
MGSGRIHQILQEAKSRQPEDNRIRAALQEVLARHPQSFSEFEKQCADLKIVLDESDAMEKSKRQAEAMDFDFAKEYSRKSDLELMLIFKDQENLVPMARSALEAELFRRELTSESVQSDPLLVETQRCHEIENAVVVNSKQLLFQQTCPRCLAAPTEASVRISPGQDFWGIRFPVVALWRYQFSRLRVPFCVKCASSIRVRRWTIRLGVLAIILVCLMLAYSRDPDRHSWMIPIAKIG